MIGHSGEIRAGGGTESGWVDGCMDAWRLAAAARQRTPPQPRWLLCCCLWFTVTAHVGVCGSVCLPAGHTRRSSGWLPCAPAPARGRCCRSCAARQETRVFEEQKTRIENRTSPPGCWAGLCWRRLQHGEILRHLAGGMGVLGRGDWDRDWDPQERQWAMLQPHPLSGQPAAFPRARMGEPLPRAAITRTCLSRLGVARVQGAVWLGKLQHWLVVGGDAA